MRRQRVFLAVLVFGALGSRLLAAELPGDYFQLMAEGSGNRGASLAPFAQLRTGLGLEWRHGSFRPGGSRFPDR